MSTSFRTNRKTRQVFPVSNIPSQEDILFHVMSRSPKKQKEYAKFSLDRRNTIEPKAPGSDNPERYNGWYNYDTWATYLILSNHESSYRWLEEWRKNFERKIKSGRFVKEAAEFAVWRYMVPTAQGKGEWAKSFQRQEESRGGQFTPQEDIDRSKVHYGEIVDAILER